MNENSDPVSAAKEPTAPQEMEAGSRSRTLFGWPQRVLPSVVVFAALGGIAYFGHQTGWTIPKFSALAGESQSERADWCSEHNIAESECVECNPALLPKEKEYGWCKKHGVPDCPFEHPEVAQVHGKLNVSQADLDRAERALALAERPSNNSKCKIHLRRIQFTSQEAVEKAGIEVEPVWESPIVESISANGEIIYDQTRIARLSSRVPGSVWRVLKNVGDTVKEGEVLALVDAAEVGRLKGEFLQAFAQVELKDKTLESLSAIAANGAVPEARLREAQAALREARIRMLSARQSLINLGFEIAAEQLQGLSEEQIAAHMQFLGLPSSITADLPPQKTTANLIAVKAPLKGIVVAREVVAGEVADTAKPLFTVADTGEMWLMLSVRQEDSKRLRLGQPIRFRPEGSSGEVKGKVTWVSTAVDEKTRTVKARAEVINQGGQLRANTFGPGQIILREEKSAIVVPNEAIHWDGDCTIVFVRDKNFLRDGSPKVFHVRKIRPGAKDEKSTEIIAGVLKGEVIATRGSAVLRAELLKSNLGES